MVIGMSHLSTLVERYEKSVKAGTDRWFQALINMVEYVSVPPLDDRIKMEEVILADRIMSAVAEKINCGRRLWDLWNRAIKLGDRIMNMRQRGISEGRIHSLLKDEIEDVMGEVDELIKEQVSDKEVEI